MASESIGLLDYEWPCPSCTYENKAGSFKCYVCGCPKGTATRQVKTLVSLEQQYVTDSYQSLAKLQKAAIAKSLQAAIITDPTNSTTTTPTATTPSASTTATSSNNSSCGSSSNTVSSKKRLRTKAASGSRRNKWPQLSNLNRSVSVKRYITVNSVRVLITEYDVLIS